MSVIMQGRRAGRYLGLARSRLKSLREPASTALTVPGGKILIANTESLKRIVIRIRDPYLAVYSYNGEEYRLGFGGATGEPFLREPTYIAPSEINFIGTATIAYAGFFTGVSLNRSVDTMGMAPDLYVDTAFVEISSLRNVWRAQTTGVPMLLASNGQVGVQFEPLGESGGQAYTAALFGTSVDPDDPMADRYDAIAMLACSADGLADPDYIWPPDSINGEPKEEAYIVSCICSAGRGNLVFIIAFDNAPPVLARLTGFGASVSYLALSTLGAYLGTLSPAAFDDKRIGIAYAGDGKMVMALPVSGSDFGLFRSTDSGQTWSSSPTPTTAAPALLGIPAHNVYSMYSGHVEYLTEGPDTRWQSIDSGLSWSSSAVLADQPIRDKAASSPIALSESGSPALWASAQVIDDQAQVSLYRGAGFDLINRIVIDKDSTYLPGPAFPPLLGFTGSRQFRPALLSGHPGELEM